MLQKATFPVLRAKNNQVTKFTNKRKGLPALVYYKDTVCNATSCSLLTLEPEGLSKEGDIQRHDREMWDQCAAWTQLLISLWQEI